MPQNILRRHPPLPNGRSSTPGVVETSAGSNGANEETSFFTGKKCHQDLSMLLNSIFRFPECVLPIIIRNSQQRSQVLHGKYQISWRRLCGDARGISASWPASSSPPLRLDQHLPNLERTPVNNHVTIYEQINIILPSSTCCAISQHPY